MKCYHCYTVENICLKHFNYFFIPNNNYNVRIFNIYMLPDFLYYHRSCAGRGYFSKTRMDTGIHRYFSVRRFVVMAYDNY